MPKPSRLNKGARNGPCPGSSCQGFFWGSLSISVKPVIHAGLETEYIISRDRYHMHSSEPRQENYDVCSVRRKQQSTVNAS